MIRGRIGEHPREQAARIAWLLLPVNDDVAGTPKVHVDAEVRRVFIQQWSGTVAAKYAEIEARLLPPVTDEALDEVERFAREHAGTEIGVSAWTALAGVLSALDIPIPGTPTRQADPTARFLRLHKALRALQDGDPTRDVSGLGSRYSMRSPVFGPDGPTRLLDAYRAFLVGQLTLPTLDEAAVDTLASGASRTMPWMLAEGRVDVAGVMERLFDEVEAASPRKAEARYLRSRYYLVQCGIVTDAPKPSMCLKARTALAALAEQGQGRYARLAHAELAAELFLEREYAQARTQYLSYVDRYPRADWAWMAALRAGQCSERVGERRRARDEYRRAAEQHAGNPVARVLGLTYAARISEAIGARTEALAGYRAARSAWNRDYGLSYTLNSPFIPVDPWKVNRRELDRRIAELAKRRE